MAILTMIDKEDCVQSPHLGPCGLPSDLPCLIPHYFFAGIASTVRQAALSLCGTSSPHSKHVFVSASLPLCVVHPTWTLPSWPVHFLESSSTSSVFFMNPSLATALSLQSCQAFVSLPCHRFLCVSSDLPEMRSGRWASMLHVVCSLVLSID